MQHSQSRAAEQRRALCLALYEQGLSKAEISERVGITERNVYRHLTALGFERPFATRRGPPRPPRLVPTRLSEVPLDVRVRAVNLLIRDGTLEGPEAQSLLAAAVWPSSQTY